MNFCNIIMFRKIMQINLCLNYHYFIVVLHTNNKSIHFKDIIHTNLKQSSSCIILGIDIKK